MILIMMIMIMIVFPENWGTACPRERFCRKTGSLQQAILMWAMMKK
jgi:hypothetical protein